LSNEALSQEALRAIGEKLDRLIGTIEKLVPERAPAPDLDAAEAFVWHPDGRLQPVARINRVDMPLLKGIDRVRDILHENTQRFASGLAANNALLWGARGMGKSSLVKAVHAFPRYRSCSTCCVTGPNA
jgi:uncharacterized protein